MKKLTLLIMVALGAACSSKKPQEKPILYPSESPEVTTTNPTNTSVNAKQVAAEQGSNLVTEITFDKKSSDLAATEQIKIQSLYQKTQEFGKIKEVQLITWADKEFPSKDKGELATAQKNLVNKRNKTIEQYIKDLDDDLKVNKISMAKRPSAFAKFVATDEAKVKESLDPKNAPDKAGKSIVIFILKK